VVLLVVLVRRGPPFGVDLLLDVAVAIQLVFRSQVYDALGFDPVLKPIAVIVNEPGPAAARVDDQGQIQPILVLASRRQVQSAEILDLPGEAAHGVVFPFVDREGPVAAIDDFVGSPAQCVLSAGLRQVGRIGPGRSPPE